MTVAVITDSAAALPTPLSARLSVTVVPMQLTIGGEAHSADDLPLDEVISRFDEGVQTASPSPAAFGDAITVADRGEGAVIVTVSEHMSSTHKSALIAAEVTGRPVRVVDSWSAAGGEALVVLAAAAAARQGLPLDAVAARAEEVRSRVRLVAAVDTLDFLVKGGRLPDLAGRAGRSLGVRPLFELRGGRIRPLRPVLRREAALDALIGYWRRSRPEGGTLHLAVSHALAEEAATRLADAIRAEVEPATFLIGSFDPVMVAHTGPGVIGLAWYWD